jgi:cobalt-zinc-cadmium efflux system membrane fusion protein
VVVPAAAVQSVNSQASVFVAESNEQFRVRAVEVGAEHDGLVDVRRGLQPGDRVAVAGAFILKSELLKTSAEAGE